MREREAGEHTEHVQLDELRNVRVVDKDERRCDRRQDEDTVRENEPVTAVDELARHEAVLREDRRKAREVLVGGVGREHQDECGRDLNECEPESPMERRVGHLRDDRLRVGGARARRVRQVGDSDEHGHGDDPEDAEGCRGVVRLIARPATSERRNAICDRFDPGQRGRP